MSFAVAAVVAGASIGAGIKSAQNTRLAGEMTHSLNMINAEYAEFDAYLSEKQGYEEIAAYQPVIDQTVSEQRAAFASEGVDVNFGTAAEIQAETKITGFMNQLEIAEQARAKALGYKREARNIRTGASVARSQSDMNANAQMTAGVVNGIGSGISMYDKGRG